MLDFTKLWDKIYLFGPNPIGMSRSDFIFFWASVGLIVIAIALKLLTIGSQKQSPKRYLLNKYFHLALTMGILFLLWVGFRFQNIPWLSTHFLVLLLWVVFLVWLGFVIKYHWQKFGKHHEEWSDGELKKRYLP